MLATETERQISPHLQKARIILLRGGSWRYLRYMHFASYLRRVADEVESVCVCGAGGGFAEVAAAIEFPHIQFTLTDIITSDGRYPNYHRAMDYAWRSGIKNISFSVWDVLLPAKHKFDLVASTEMLEHIENDGLATKNMRAAAKKYTYCLVPFAESNINADPVIRKRAWDRCEHFVCGYDPQRLQELFGNPVAMAGAYWMDAGTQFRTTIKDMPHEEIDRRATELFADAERDDKQAIPTSIHEAGGIKILARA